MPFGEEITPDGTHRTSGLKYNFGDNVRQKFTGYQKDEETQLDFAEARMYQNLHDRFTAVDPLLASGKSADPQTFNRYFYVMNRPLTFVDPTGLQAGTSERTGKRIFVFIFLKPDERQGWNKDWKSLQREARRKGHELKMYFNSPNVKPGSEANAENYINALTTDRATVISVGHSLADPKPRPGKNTLGVRFYGSGINIGGETYLTTNGISDRSTGDSFDVSGLQVAAGEIIINSCDVTNFVPFLESKMEEGSSIVYNDNGNDGLALVPADMEAAYKQTRAAIRGADTVEAGQQAIDRPIHQNMRECPTCDPANRGDKIRRKGQTKMRSTRLTDLFSSVSIADHGDGMDWILSISIITAFLFSGCGTSMNSSVGVNTGTTASPAVLRDDGVCADRPQVTDPDGFELPIVLDMMRPKVENRTLSKKYRGVEVNLTTYQPEDGLITKFEIAAALLNLPTENWIVTIVSEYKVGANRFQVAIILTRKGVPVKTEFVYTDTDGNGTLDLVCTSGGDELPKVPTWAVN